MARPSDCATIIQLLLLLNAEGVIPCVLGRYGDACDQHCPPHCAMLHDSTVRDCGIRTGKCYDGCAPGWYGDHCNETCSRNCMKNKCGQSNGNCTLGCKDIYIGDFCSDETMYKNRSISVIGALLTLVTAVTAMMMILGRPWILRHIRYRHYRILRPFIDWSEMKEMTQSSHQHGSLDNAEGRQLNEDTHTDTEAQMARPTQESELQASSDGINLKPLKHRATEKSDKHGSFDTSLDRRPNVDTDRETQESDLEATQAPAHRIQVEDSKLYGAIYRGDLKAVKRILASGLADVDYRDRDGRTGADVSMVDGVGNNILHFACVVGHVEMVKFILSLDMLDINSRGERNRTPLIVAALCRHGEVVEFLVREGADVSLMDSVGNNILHLACVVGQVETVKFIISLDMLDINSRGESNITPVMVAARCGRWEVVKFLVSKTADLSLVDDKGDNALHYACAKGDMKIVEYILSQDSANINSRGQRCRTPVMVAALGGHEEVVKFLVSARADVSLIDDEGDNILHFACVGGGVKTVKFILSQDMANINSRGEQKRTPVMVAALYGHREVVKFLVSERADVSLVDDDGDNILHLACAGGNMRMVKFILSRDMAHINSRGHQRRTSVMVAALGGHAEVVKFLVSERADVSLMDDDGDNILHFACVGGGIETVKFILSQNMTDINSSGWLGAPVMLAAHYGHREIVKILVSERTDLSIVDDDGDNILHWACAGGDVRTVEFICSQKLVDINRRGCWGTPVMLAAQNGHREIVNFLVSKGADVSLVTDRGNNILHFACVGGDVETVKFVLAQGKPDTDARNKKGQTAADVATFAKPE